MTTNKGLCAALGAALLLTACSQGTPPSVARAQAAQRQAQAEIKTGVRAFGHHSYKIALSHFDRALALDSHNADALYDRGLTEEQLRSTKHAESDLASAVKLRPSWNAARVHLAAEQYHTHHFADSAKNFDVALKASSKSAVLWLDDGVSYYHLARYADARKRFARALALAPRSGRAHYWLGMTYNHLGNKPKAQGELALAAHSRDVVVRTAARRELRAR